MSTQIGTVNSSRGKVLLTQFYGGDTDGLCLQITQGVHFVELTYRETVALSNAIMSWYLKRLDETHKRKKE